MTGASLCSQRRCGVKPDGDLEQIFQIVGVSFDRLFPRALHLLNHADQFAGVLRIGGVAGALQRMRRLLRLRAAATSA